MKNLKKNLQAVNKDLNALSKKVEKLIAAVGKPEKPKASKAKPVKKAVVKTGKTAVAKKVTGKTASETVLAIIKRSKKGVDTATLKKKTGIKDNVLLNVVYRLKKQGKIKSERKGFYEKV